MTFLLLLKCNSKNLIIGISTTIDILTGFVLIIKFLYFQTDDQAMLCCSLYEEYVHVARTLTLDPQEVFNLSYSTTEYITKNLIVNEKFHISNQFTGLPKLKILIWGILKSNNFNGKSEHNYYLLLCTMIIY